MSKKKVQAAAKAMARNLGDYTPQQQAELTEIVGRMLASLPGGDLAEDMMFEPFDAVSWREFEMISNLFSALDDSMDVQKAIVILFASDPEAFVVSLDNMDRDDGSVLATVSGDGAAYWAEIQQSIAGSRWESDGPDMAYAVLSDHSGLIGELEDEEYVIDDSEYVEPD